MQLAPQMFKFDLLDEELMGILNYNPKVKPSYQTMLQEIKTNEDSRKVLENDYQVISQHFESITKSHDQNSRGGNNGLQQENVSETQNTNMDGLKPEETQVSCYSKDLNMDIEGGMQFYLGDDSQDLSNLHFVVEDNFSLNGGNQF